MRIAEITPQTKTYITLTGTELSITPGQIADALLPNASSAQRFDINLDIEELVGLAKLGLETLHETERER